MIEQEVAEQWRCFDLWLQLAEAHGRHSGNLQHAEKIVRQIESNGGFGAEQSQTAEARLEEWRSGEKADG